MKAWDFEAVAYDGAVYCVDCLPTGVGVDADDVSPVFADSEWDSYPTCDACGTVHDYVSLTPDGAMQADIDACEDVPYFDRFDVCEAFYVLRMAGYVDGTDGRLERMGFSPRARLSRASTTADAYFALSDNGRAIFAREVRRASRYARRQPATA
jgi:hypothetical protein